MTLSSLCSARAALLLIYIIERQPPIYMFFFFNDTATTEIYTLSLHDALPILNWLDDGILKSTTASRETVLSGKTQMRSEEHTSELQSPDHLVCRLLLEKKKRYSIHKCCKLHVGNSQR